MLSGKQIAEARKRKGLTQEALAAELGVSRQTIAKWEQEISTPSVTNAHRLIDILGLQEMENKSSTEDEGNARTICKKRLTKRLLIELWAVYAISVVLILVAIVVQEVRGKKTDSPMKILLGGICFIGLAILAVVAILASGFVLRENYQHKAFYSVPAIQLKKYSAINEWIDECKTIGPDIYGQCIELPSDKTICLYIVYRHQVTDASDANLVSDPLHMRFIAKYRGGTEYDGVDLYFLQGRSSYQMLFSIDGSEPYYNSMATVNPMLIDDVKALFNNLQGDEKNA